MYLEKNNNKKPKPRTYDMTFCTSNCKNKCDRHYSKYSFDTGRLYSMADFNCNEVKKRERNNRNSKETSRAITKNKK